MACGNCGREEYVKEALRYCSGCRKIVIECDCVTYGLVPHITNYRFSIEREDFAFSIPKKFAKVK